MNKPKYSLREVVREDKRLVREFLDLPKSTLQQMSRVIDDLYAAVDLIYIYHRT